MEQHQQHQPPLYQEGEVMKAVRPGPADSPPPNCAICLGTCTNKCFTDCCMHQFCFNCLLEWSKVNNLMIHLMIVLCTINSYM